MDDHSHDDAGVLEHFRGTPLRRPEGTPILPHDLATSAPRRGGDGQEIEPIDPREMDSIAPGLRRLFIVETTDDLQDLSRALITLELCQDDPALLRDMRRIAHKIKGAAATLEYDVMAELAHIFEDMLATLRALHGTAGQQVMAPLQRCLGLLQVCLDAASAETAPDATVMTEALALREEISRAVPSAAPRLGTDAAFAPVFSGDSARLPARVAEGESLLRVDVRRLDGLMARVSALATNRATLAHVREGIARFQAEMDHALGRLKMASDQVAELQPFVEAMADRLPSNGGHHTSAAPRPSQALPRPAARGSASFGGPALSGGRPWAEPELDRYSEFDHALRALTEAVADVTANAGSLRGLLHRLSQTAEAQGAIMAQMQQDVTAIRLVPLQGIIPRLQVAARQVAQDLRKQVTFTVHGEMTEIDRNISEAITDPLIQLVRNAIVHGIEPSEERLEAGKPESGSVGLHAYYVGNEVIIEVGDDGCGINAHRLVAAAIAAGMLDAEAGRTLSEADALDLMFVQGLSTLEEAHVAGGRGIGLDEVRTVIERLKGTIHVRSEPERGTIFRIRVPISLSILHILQVQLGQDGYAVPFSAVRRTLSLPSGQIHRVTPVGAAGGEEGAQPAARISRRVRIEVVAEALARDDAAPGLAPDAAPEAWAAERSYEEMPAFALAELLGYTYQPRNPQPTLVVEIGQQRIALLVDGVRDDHEVVVRALPKHLRRRAVRGATVTLEGQALLLLDLPELVSGVLEGKWPREAPRPAPRFARTPAPRVMVADDSVSMRGALEVIL
ncbi:MAG: chemotaxis protein CheW, partial [Ktedonobacterales bacterium]|nr:chemotaxis protein CheW [Ktedonobacterales bacterium]